MTGRAAPAPPGPIWHELPSVAGRSDRIVKLFTRCVHEVVRFDAKRAWVAGRCGGGGPEVELRRDRLRKDYGTRVDIVRVSRGGADVPDFADFFEGFTPGWRTPSRLSEAGERTRAARERNDKAPPLPFVHYPAGIWHEAHPGRPDVPLIRICHHPAVKVTERFVYVVRTCAPWVRTSPPYGPQRLSREGLARGEGVAAWTDDKDARGCAYSTAAWFFEGPVPARPHRPAAWLRCQEDARRMWAMHDREAAERAARAAQQRADDERWRREFDDALRAAGAGLDCAAELAALGLDAMPADLDVLKRAWREAARRTHPDAGGTAEAFTLARAAYERLARRLGAEVGA